MLHDDHNGTVFIYGLADPSTGQLRYIGQSANPKNRLRQHIQTAKQGGPSHRDRWLRTLQRMDVSPSLVILERTDRAGWPEAERRHIYRARQAGLPVVNQSDGGDGAPGYTQGTGVRISAAHKGRASARGTKDARPVVRRDER